METEVIPDDVVSLFDSDVLTNKNFQTDINSFVEQDKSKKKGSGTSTTHTTKENKNKTETNKNDQIMNYYIIENYLVEDKLPVKEFKNSNNFVKKSVFPEKMREILLKIKVEFTPPPPQLKPNNHPFILIMETINDNKLYTVYQDLVNKNFSIIAYNLKKVKNPIKANYLIIRNNPYLNNNYLLVEFNNYKNYFSNFRKKEIIDLSDNESKNNKNKKKRF